MMHGVVGIDERTVDVLKSLLIFSTKGLTRASDAALARERLCIAVEVVMRDVRDKGTTTAILTDAGLWFPDDMTPDEKIAFALDLLPRLRRRLPRGVWKDLQVRS